VLGEVVRCESLQGATRQAFEMLANPNQGATWGVCVAGSLGDLCVPCVLSPRVHSVSIGYHRPVPPARVLQYGTVPLWLVAPAPAPQLYVHTELCCCLLEISYLYSLFSSERVCVPFRISYDIYIH
jgi:hypothetical protein